LISPLCAVAIASFGFPLLSGALQRAGLNGDHCLCVEAEVASMVTSEGVVLVETAPGLRVILDREVVCAQPGSQTLFGFNGRTLLDAGHFLSAGAVSFARGLNDTPKIVALGLVAGTLELRWSVLLVAATMALGGALFGIGIANGRAHWKMIRTILMAWLLTPVAAVFSAAVYLLIRHP
jgi:PiT family inorganic phosphate transporter